jgi:dihydrolipoamide dehydrogenase
MGTFSPIGRTRAAQGTVEEDVVEQFDVIVVGGGSSGENIAGRCKGNGLTIAVVEAGLVGGECSYWACMPSKTLLRPGEVLAEARRVPGAATAVIGAIDVDTVLDRRDEIVSDWDDGPQVQWVEGHDGVVVRGYARFVGRRRVDVTTPDGTVRKLEARRAVVLASGSTPVIPPIDGLADINYWTSRDATSAEGVPERLLVLGGGVVGVELAQAFKRLGAHEVTVVEAADRLVADLEPFAGDELREAFAADGIQVLLGLKVVKAERVSPRGTVSLTLEDGHRVDADELLVAVGRSPATGDLGLDTIGLEPGKPVDVDDRMRATGVPGGWLYAIGDVNGRALLTHMGKYQARIAGDNALHDSAIDAAPGHRAVPSIVFTDPQIATVGLTEQRAREQGIPVRSVQHGTGDTSGAAVHGKGITGTSQLVVDDARRVVVGATFVGPGVAELLHSATIAIVAEVPLDVLWHAVPSFPTVSEVWLRLLEAYGL